MKKSNFFLGLATIVAMSSVFTACSSDDVDGVLNYPQDGAIHLTTTLATTRATSDPQATQLSTSVKVGAFGVSSNSIIANGNNNQYTVASNGDLSASTNMSWPGEGSVSIYAYAPYAAGWTYNADNAFTVATDQSTDTGYLASDLVYGTPTSNPVSQTTDAIALKFVHKLAQVKITVNNSISGLDLSNSTISIMNTMIATTLNPSTGAIGDASGSTADIKIATSASAASYGIIVPQTVDAGTAFVKISTDATTYTASLTSATTFESGKAYSFTMNISGSSDKPTITLTLGSTSVNNWEDATGSLNDAEEAVTYGVGDYLLADGTLVKKANIGSQTPAAVIFSTTVSATDAAAGYGAYAMALKRYKSRTFALDDNHTAMLSTGAGTWSEGLADLDGRTHTINMLASEYYATLSDDDKAASIINMTGFTPTLSGDTNSGWFLPSFGQMIQIMNVFGEAGITESTVENGDYISSNSNFYTSADDALSTLVANVQANVTLADADLFAVGSVSYATSTENNSTSSSHLQKFWTIQCASAGTYAFGKSAKRSGTTRSVIPVTAVKLPTE